MHVGSTRAGRRAAVGAKAFWSFFSKKHYFLAFLQCVSLKAGWYKMAMVLQDEGAVLAECCGDAVAFFGGHHDTAIIVEHAVIVVEEQPILGERIEFAAEHRPCLAVGGMGVRGR